MPNSSEYAIEKVEINTLLEQLKQCGEVKSVFFKPKPTVIPRLASDEPLSELFASEAFADAGACLGEVFNAKARCSTLNRLEFEGSLVSVVLRGGCHGPAVALSEQQARTVVLPGVAAAFPAPFEEICAFRIDEEEWCQFTKEATLSSSYLVWQGARGLWWLLCVADID